MEEIWDRGSGPLTVIFPHRVLEDSPTVAFLDPLLIVLFIIVKIRFFQEILIEFFLFILVVLVRIH